MYILMVEVQVLLSTAAANMSYSDLRSNNNFKTEPHIWES